VAALSNGRKLTMCSHCLQRPLAARGIPRHYKLCPSCYFSPLVRKMLGVPGQLMAPKNVKPEDYQPTEAMPGSREKVAVMAARVERGLPLWHPLDAPCTGILK
jgi:hypothetical protein